jgi:hypothetical protein
VCRAQLNGDGTIYFVISLCDILCELPEPHGARGDICAGNLSTASGDRLSRNCTKVRRTPVVDLCNIM